MSARTVKEATDLALDRLGVDEEDAELQVLEEPQPGLFGRTRGKARVRARVSPRPQPQKQERRERRRGGGRSRRGGSAGAARSGAVDAAPAAGEDDDGDDTIDSPSNDDTSSESGASPRPRRRRRGSRSGASREAAPAAAEGDNVESKTFTLDEHVACVEGFVRGLVDAFGAEATIRIDEVDEDTREIKIEGDDLGLLIGPRGLTLQAIHEVARTVVYRAAPDGQDGRVRIDIGGYRERRRHALEQFAAKIAGEVADSGRARTLEPMSPPDRKVVHDTINGIEGVRTTSEGEEPRRRVVVLPAD